MSERARGTGQPVNTASVARPWVGPIRRGWVVRDEVPGPDVDEFAEPDRVIAALASLGTRRSLLAVQHPHRTPDALAAGLRLSDALPFARTTLST